MQKTFLHRAAYNRQNPRNRPFPQTFVISKLCTKKAASATPKGKKGVTNF
jgi:hypothetical protein